MLVFEERGKPGVPREKPLGAAKGENQQQTQTRYAVASTPGDEPGPHCFKASALTIAPPLLPNVLYFICNIPQSLQLGLSGYLSKALTEL